MNLYLILGISFGATQEEIRAAYLKIRSSAHPDKQGDASMFIQIQHAYDVLSDEKRRMEYDATGNTNQVSDSKAQTTLIEMIVSTINGLNPDQQDPIAIVRHGIVQSRAGVQAQIKAYENNIARHEKFCKRIIRKGGKENFLTQSLQHGIEQMHKQIAACVLNIAMGEEMLLIIDEFEYQMPQQESPAQLWYIGGAGMQSGA